MTIADTAPGFHIGPVRVPVRVIMAPLAGLTDGPFRIVAAECGCRAFWTEMIPAEALIRRREEALEMLPRPAEPRPTAVQLFGAEPSSLVEAAVIAEAAGADLVDLNMACPVSRITRLGAGAALMRDPARAALLARAVAGAVSVPVTAKIRAGWDEHSRNALEVAGAVVAEGVAAVSIHARTRSQGFAGRADHGVARELAGALGVPVIVSGDIADGRTAQEVLGLTGAAAVMIGRAAVGNPWIYDRIRRELEEGDASPAAHDRERLSVMTDHLDLMIARYGDARAASLFRGHLVGYLKGRPGAGRWRRELVLERSAGVLKERLAALFAAAATDSAEIRPALP